MNALAATAFLFLLSSPIVSSKSVCAADKQCNRNSRTPSMEEKDGLNLLQTNSKLLTATRADAKELVDQVLLEARVNHITEDERERIVSELESKSVSIEESMSNKRKDRRRRYVYSGNYGSGETSSRPGGPPNRVGGFGRGRR